MSSELIGIAADHGGFALKYAVVAELKALGFEVLDLGTDSEEPVDYPDMAETLIEAFKDGRVSRGFLICGTGIGISIAANRPSRHSRGTVLRHRYRGACPAA